MHGLQARPVANLKFGMAQLGRILSELSACRGNAMISLPGQIPFFTTDTIVAVATLVFPAAQVASGN